MAYPSPDRLRFPLESYAVTGRKFLEEAVFGGQSWGRHLGEDCLAEPGTPVCAIGDGDVAYAALHASWLRRRGNWGHVVILGHTHAADKSTARYTAPGISLGFAGAAGRPRCLFLGRLGHR